MDADGRLLHDTAIIYTLYMRDDINITHNNTTAVVPGAVDDSRTIVQFINTQAAPLSIHSRYMS